MSQEANGKELCTAINVGFHQLSVATNYLSHVLHLAPAQKIDLSHVQPKQRNRVLIATGGITGQGDFSVLHRPHVGFRPGDVEQVRRSGAGGRRCTAGGCTAGGATGRLR